MKSVETLMTLRRGGAVPGALIGVLLGAVGVPLVLLTKWALLLFAVPAFLLARALRRRTLPMDLVGLWLPIVAISALVWARYTPRMDRRLYEPLPSAHIALDELDRRIAWGDDDVPPISVDLPSRQPTWNEIDAALAPLGYRLKIGFCGTCDLPMTVRIVRSG